MWTINEILYRLFLVLVYKLWFYAYNESRVVLAVFRVSGATDLDSGVCLFFLFPFSAVYERALPALSWFFVPAASNAACTHRCLCLDSLWIVVWTSSSIKTDYYLSVKGWCLGWRPSRTLLSEKQASPKMFPFLFKWSLLRWVWIISVCVLETVDFYFEL